ncbi:hypothetical protein FACS189419_04060 [Planctomycetales bacterium]|nr:hypothetical protein FACS189419_04060 [Planctomycetales bacterium]
MNRETTEIPELLAPAGNEAGLCAAVENGADAVYFGLAEPHNFNARSRAGSFPLEKIEETFAYLHRRGVKGYVAFNTLVHYAELKQAEFILEKIAEADADAVIVQDLGVVKLAQTVCPELPLHASTQMSLTSARSIERVRELGIRRAVLPRELSLKQIQMIRKETDIELECFIHGALCISFSGQCYASLGLGGRSANRGCCAQPCRLPYKLITANTKLMRNSNQDVGQSLPKNAGSEQLLSPHDLSALPLLPELLAAGVNALKIEGRLKAPEYVAEVTRIYRTAIEDITAKKHTNTENPFPFSTFSRGFSTGWLEGVNPHRLVPGDVKSHRGTPLGTVIEVRRDAAVVQLSAPVKRGDGVLFENEKEPEKPQGGRVYEIIRRRESVKSAEAGAKVLLTFANNSLDADCIAEGQVIWKTDDPRQDKELRRQLESPQNKKRVPLQMYVRAAAGSVMQLTVTSPTGLHLSLESETVLEPARKHPLTAETLREQLDRLGDTLYALGKLEAEIEGNPMVPLSVLGKLRRKLVEGLEDFQPPLTKRTVHRNSLEKLRSERR